MKVFTVLIFVLIFVTACGSKKKDVETDDSDKYQITDTDKTETVDEASDETVDEAIDELNDNDLSDDLSDEVSDTESDENVDETVDESNDNDLSDEILTESDETADEDGDTDEIVMPFCGNGVVDGDDSCDDGNLSNEDDCKNDCTWNYCGDGFVNAGVEVCDGEPASCSSLGLGTDGTAICMTCDYWLTAGNCSQSAACPVKPDVVTIWNDYGNSGTYLQTWDGSAWMPELSTSFSTESGDCKYQCAPDYYWSGSECKAIVKTGAVCSGQKKCYDNNAEMICPLEGNDFYGTDSQYSALNKCTNRSFTISGASGNDVVKDNNTGLLWQRIMPSKYTGCTMGNPVGSKCKMSEAVSYCENLNYGGYSDWRLPSRNEISTIPDYGSYSSIDSTFYYTSEYYWTSTLLSSNTNKGWFAAIRGGSLSSQGIDLAGNAWCVRGDPLIQTNNFVESSVEGKVIVTDTSTGLIWTKEISVEKTWKDALSYCENATYANYNDWRLPNVKELETLVDDTKFDPASGFPGLSSLSIWSSTTSEDSGNGAFYLYFYTGGVFVHSKTAEINAICVR